MIDWRPSSGPDVAKRRAALLRRLRAYFDACSLIEVDTPALSRAAVSDVHIESLAVTSSLSSQPLYLHTSPEFFMKRMLAAGYPDIYSICRVFRDGEVGQNHQPEFTMLEWYRLGFNLDAIIQDTTQAIAIALQEPHLSSNYETLNYQDAFLSTCGIDPLNCSIETLADVMEADQQLRKSLGNEHRDWLDLILSVKILPGLATDKLTVLQHYPVDQAALARSCPNDAGVADRFEVFLGTTEIANGYVELIDGKIQSDRISADQAYRKSHGLPQRPVDQAFIDALDFGLPACAGVAMGLERLQMLYDKSNNINDVITFAFEVSDD